jgi:hypothetical protein
MTGYAVEDRVEKALSLKAAICLKKPFALEDLTAVIHTNLPS